MSEVTTQSLETQLVNEIIFAYHTTRITHDFAAHILSKPMVRELFDRLASEQPADALREAATRLWVMRSSIMTDINSAHSGRGAGASQSMREDDADMRRDIRAAFDALSAALGASK